jgi:hypothetical protein
MMWKRISYTGNVAVLTSGSFTMMLTAPLLQQDTNSVASQRHLLATSPDPDFQFLQVVAMPRGREHLSEALNTDHRGVLSLWRPFKAPSGAFAEQSSTEDSD